MEKKQFSPAPAAHWRSCILPVDHPHPDPPYILVLRSLAPLDERCGINASPHATVLDEMVVGLYEQSGV
jgi:hypothetical protein